MRRALIVLAALVTVQFAAGFVTSVQGTIHPRSPTTTQTVVLSEPQVPLTISANASYVHYGQSFELSGIVSDAKSGRPLTIFSREAGTTKWTVEANTATLPNTNHTPRGMWAYPVTPKIGTEYMARSQGVASKTVFVRVGPRLTLTEAGPDTFAMDIREGFAIKPTTVLLQRFGSGRWQTVARVTVQSPDVGPPFATEVDATFRARLPRGTSRLRAFVTRAEAGAGYVAAASLTLVYRR